MNRTSSNPVNDHKRTRFDRSSRPDSRHGSGRSGAAVAAVVITAGLLLVAWYLVLLIEGRNLEHHRVILIHRLSEIRANLESGINHTLHLTVWLGAHVAIHPDIDENAFQALAGGLFGQSDNVRNIGLAKDGVIQFVYPRAGNEAVIGMHYDEIPEQWEAVERAIRLRTTVVAGPVALQQGGTGIIGRTPIYLPGEDGSPAGGPLWGLSSIVVDAGMLFRDAGMGGRDEAFGFALRGRDAKGADGEVFFGDPGVFDADPVVLDISLPEGSWQLAGAPLEGWKRACEVPIFGCTLIFLVPLAFGVLIYLVLAERNQIRFFALHDPLTHLPNRRLLADRVNQAMTRAKRQGGHNVLVAMDLDDFKGINDRYGHGGGDLILKQVARRLMDSVRDSDTVGRIGGDEFVVFLEGVSGREVTVRVVETILENLGRPMDPGMGECVGIGVSIGIAVHPLDGSSLEELILLADRALYDAKASGKATYRFHSRWT